MIRAIDDLEIALGRVNTRLTDEETRSKAKFLLAYARLDALEKAEKAQAKRLDAVEERVAALERAKK